MLVSECLLWSRTARARRPHDPAPADFGSVAASALWFGSSCPFCDVLQFEVIHSSLVELQRPCQAELFDLPRHKFHYRLSGHAIDTLPITPIIGHSGCAVMLSNRR